MKRPIIAILVILLLFISIEIATAQNKVDLYLFYAKTCPHCRAERQFLSSIKNKYPKLVIHEFEVTTNKRNAILFTKMCEAYNTNPQGVPTTFIGDDYIIGFGQPTIKELEDKIKECTEVKCTNPGKRINLTGTEEKIIKEKPIKTKENQTNTNKTNIVNIPLIGEIDISKIGLPLFTIILGGLDGFNPCAMWVLCFLLTLLLHAKSRKRMLLVGGIFVFTSAIVYFLFMAAWLNFFLLVGYVNILRMIIAIIAIIAGLINTKDFFFFKKGISLTIPESAKPKLFKRMRRLVYETFLPTMIVGTIILAFTANTFELLCTAGFPAIYTRVLTLKNLPTLTYYSYLALYNIVYVIPLAVIVLIFVFTMGAHKFTEKQGRWLKLIGGLLMLMLGSILLIKPELLTFS